MDYFSLKPLKQSNSSKMSHSNSKKTIDPDDPDLLSTAPPPPEPMEPVDPRSLPLQHPGPTRRNHNFKSTSSISSFTGLPAPHPHRPTSSRNSEDDLRSIPTQEDRRAVEWKNRYLRTER